MSKYFRNSYQYAWSNLDDISKINAIYDGKSDVEIEFSVPQLHCYAAMTEGGVLTPHGRKVVIACYRRIVVLKLSQKG